MPPSEFQTRVLRAIAANRTPDSHVARGVALNRDFPRFSYDIDLFQDEASRVVVAAEATLRP